LGGFGVLTAIFDEQFYPKLALVCFLKGDFEL
jgi:hypothetical protein